jgi:PEGA domain-containing protein
MKLNMMIPAAILGAFALASNPAFADDQHAHDGHTRAAGQAQGDRGHAVQRSPEAPRAQAPRAEAPRAQAPRAEAPRAQAPRAEAPRAEAPRAQAPRAESPRVQAPRAEAPRAQTPRAVEVPRAESRQNDNRGRTDGRQYNRNDNRRDLGHVVTRGDSRAPIIVRPRVVRPVIVPRYYGSRGYYSAPYLGYRPYSFRPRTRIGFGIFLGYPVPYAYSYPYPVPVYGYGSPSVPVVVGPGSSDYGGVSLEISPNDAEVYVDGSYAGVVQDFDGTAEPLTLAAGAHRIELRAPGYEPMTLDVSVNPSEVVPYRGDLQPLRY